MDATKSRLIVETLESLKKYFKASAFYKTKII